MPLVCVCEVEFGQYLLGLLKCTENGAAISNIANIAAT